MNLRYSTIVILLAIASVQVEAKVDCRLCEELKKVAEEYKVTTDAPEERYVPLQNKATEIIQKMPNKAGKLTRPQVAEIVAVIRLAVVPDPVEAILVNNIEIIDKNKAAFDKEFAKLPSAERKEIELGLAVARSNQPDELPKKK